MLLLLPGQDVDGQKLDLSAAEMIPLEPTHLSFWTKFWELQFKMLFGGDDGEMEHKYSSSPTDWPFMNLNIAYWMSVTSNVSWTMSLKSSSISVPLFSKPPFSPLNFYAFLIIVIWNHKMVVF